MSYQFDTTSSTAQIGGGYTCAQCGGWVGYGVTHTCWGRTSPVQPTPTPTPTFTFSPVISDADVERIARRVVELLRANE